MMHARFKISMAWLNSALFFILLLAGGVLFIFTTKQAVSETEKRTLKSMPAFSWESVGNGQYLRGIDDYIADNFVFRYALTEFAGQIKTVRGWNNDDIELFTSTQTTAKNSSTTATSEEHAPVTVALEKEQQLAPNESQATESNADHAEDKTTIKTEDTTKEPLITEKTPHN